MRREELINIAQKEGEKQKKRKRLKEGCGIPNSIVESSMYAHIYAYTHI